MPEERKLAPLPPLPWKANLDPWYARTQILDSEGCIIAEIVGTDEDAVAIADLFCRAPALESEVARQKEVVDWACEILARHAGVEAEAGEEKANG